MKTRSIESGFTLLEIMVTLAVMAVAVFGLMQAAEGARTQLYQARNANWARMLARELLSELEFRELDRTSGPIEGYPGFEYEIEIEEEDLVTGQEEDDEDENKTGSSMNDSQFTPGDSYFPEDDEEDVKEYPVRRVKLTLRYPNVKSGADQPLELVIETIFPALPEEEDNSPIEGVFGSNSGN